MLPFLLKKASSVPKGKAKNVKTLFANKLSNTLISQTPFTAIGPSTNIKIKVTDPGKI